MVTLINVLIVVIIIGLIYWIVMSLPLPPPFKLVAQVIMAIIAIVLLLGLIGVVPSPVRWR